MFKAYAFIRLKKKKKERNTIHQLATIEGKFSLEADI